MARLRLRLRLRLRAAAPLLLLASPALALQSDFSFYPQNAQPCLNQASDAADCQGSSAAELNTCLCSNKGGFVTNTARCLGQSDEADVLKVYTTMLQACTDSHTPLSVSQSDFLAAAAANGGTASTTTTTAASSTASSTATSATAKVTTTGGVTVTVTPTPTETGAADRDSDKQAGGGLSTGATIGLAVGASIAGLAALAALALFLVRRRQRRTQEEAHPMLSPHEYHHQTPTTFPPTEPSPDFSRLSGAESKAGGWSPGPYAPPYKSPGAVAELPPHGAMHGHGAFPYEMDGSGVPPRAAEMQGDAPPPPQYHMRR